MIKWRSVVLGAATFVAAHVVMVRTWTTWFDGQREPWFLNSGRGVGFTALSLVVAGMVAGACWARNRDQATTHGVNVAAGAVVAMTLVLVAVGPGTIFPIAIAFGAATALFSSVAGSLIVWLFKGR